MPVRLEAGRAGFEEGLGRLVGAARGDAADVRATVAAIIERVRSEGDPAVVDLTRELDRLDTDITGLRVSASDIETAAAEIDPDTREALELAAARIRAFHESQLPAPIETTDALGVRMGMRWTPIDSVGLYVPGGTAAYPSSVLMNAIPARVAGCRRLVMTVPAPDGRLAPLVLAAAALASIDEIWRIGGAQAIAALAYGTASISPVDKIVGPGNVYVAEAKRQVFGRVGIDSIAGPSEILVVADRTADPGWVAADLLSQAEHDELAQAILITDDPALADAVEAEVGRQLESLPRRKTAAAAWRDHGALIVVGDMADVPAIVDRLAPEHLELMVAEPEALAARIRNAGAMFLGHHTAEVIGDYVGGPNHVLPTDRSARFASGLSVHDFMKRTTSLSCPEAALRVLGPAAATLARAEGLEAHARAVEVRRGR